MVQQRTRNPTYSHTIFICTNSFAHMCMYFIHQIMYAHTYKIVVPTALQLTATQHTNGYVNIGTCQQRRARTRKHCNILQRPATPCNTLICLYAHAHQIGDELYSDSTGLLAQSVEMKKDIGGLFGKISRKAKVERDNDSIATGYTADLYQQVGAPVWQTPDTVCVCVCIYTTSLRICTCECHARLRLSKKNSIATGYFAQI